MYTSVIFCLLSALPHFIYGPGSDSLMLTEELGSNKNIQERGTLAKIFSFYEK